MPTSPRKRRTVSSLSSPRRSRRRKSRARSKRRRVSRTRNVRRFGSSKSTKQRVSPTRKANFVAEMDTPPVDRAMNVDTPPNPGAETLTYKITSVIRYLTKKRGSAMWKRTKKEEWTDAHGSKVFNHRLVIISPSKTLGWFACRSKEEIQTAIYMTLQEEQPLEGEEIAYGITNLISMQKQPRFIAFTRKHQGPRVTFSSRTEEMGSDVYLKEYNLNTVNTRDKLQNIIDLATIGEKLYLNPSYEMSTDEKALWFGLREETPVSVDASFLRRLTRKSDAAQREQERVKRQILSEEASLVQRHYLSLRAQNILGYRLTEEDKKWLYPDEIYLIQTYLEKGANDDTINSAFDLFIAMEEEVGIPAIMQSKMEGVKI